MFGQAAMVIHGGEGKMLFGEAIFRMDGRTSTAVADANG